MPERQAIAAQAATSRAHVNALGMQFMTAYFDQITTWADWALRETGGREDTTTPARTWAAQARAIFADTARPRDADRPGKDTAGKDS